jgi:hypothetical protein
MRTQVAQTTDYRVYVLGSDGYFSKTIYLDCLNDAAAIEVAKQFINRNDIELWQRDRKIAKFDGVVIAER